MLDRHLAAWRVDDPALEPAVRARRDRFAAWAGVPVLDAPGSAWGERVGGDGLRAAIEADGRLTTGAMPFATWHAAADDGVRAWSTSPTAAAYLATGRAEVDEEAVPELLSLGALLPGRSLVRGVRVLAPGAEVDAAGRERLRSTRAERWAPVEPAAAGETAWAGLVDHLARHVGGETDPWLALTAGRDSPLVALAARDAGLNLRAFTWGDEDWPDVLGARRLAARLGLEHRATPIALLGEEEGMRHAADQARWGEGLVGAAVLGQPQMPAGMTACVTGAGAEIARAYFYTWTARSRPQPRPRDLVDALGAEHPAVRARLEAWVEETWALVPGWTALDVYYAEVRVGRWGRARFPRGAAAWLAPFVAPAVARALVSMPLEERLAMAWHQHHADRLGLVLERRPTQRRGVPAPLRRAAAALRRRAARPAPTVLAGPLAERPAIRAWLTGEALERAGAVDAMGAAWAERVRRDLGAATATESALLCGGLALYRDALTALA